MSARRRGSRSLGVAWRARGGFSLVELMVAIVLLTVGLFGSAALMATSLRYQRGTSGREEMLALGEAKLDELRSYQTANLASGLRPRLAPGGSTTSSVNGYADSLTSPQGKPYRRRWQITTSVIRTREIQIRVEPRYADGYVTPGITLRTLIQVH
jgi:prepilin-type N-terminal cleavage/methylation domain-containing protein